MHPRRSDTPQHARAHNPARRLARAHFVLTHGRPTHSQIPTFGVDGRARIRHASRTPSARHCVASASTRRASGIQLRWRRSPQTPLSTATAARRSLVYSAQLSMHAVGHSSTPLRRIGSVERHSEGIVTVVEGTARKISTVGCTLDGAHVRPCGGVACSIGTLHAACCVMFILCCMLHAVWFAFHAACVLHVERCVLCIL